MSTDSQPLTENEINQIKGIYCLLTSSVKNLDAEDGCHRQRIEDHITWLTKRLTAKTIRALKFVAIDLHCKPIHGDRIVEGGRILKVYWVNTLIQWVRLSELVTLVSSQSCSGEQNLGLLVRNPLNLEHEKSSSIYVPSLELLTPLLG